MRDVTKNLFATDLDGLEGNEVTYIGYIRSLNTQKGTSNPFIALTLTDKTGVVNAKIWSENMQPEHAHLLEHYVKVRAVVGKHKGTVMLNVSKIVKIDKEEIDLGDFVEVLVDQKNLASRIISYVNQVSDPFLFQLLARLFNNDEFLKNYVTIQGATQLHHDYMGGLAVHSLKVLDGAMAYLAFEDDPMKPKLDRDMVIAGGLLFGVGKMEAYEPFPDNKRTVRGKLLGHTHLATEIIQAAFYEVCAVDKRLVDLEAYDRLMHIVLSVHEDIRNLKPMTLEAVLISKQLQLASDMSGLDGLIRSEQGGDDSFTSHSNYYNRQMMKG